MADKLDRSRPYGTITPPHNGASYHQDGRYFDGRGLPVLSPGEAPVRKAAPVAAPAEAPEAGPVVPTPAPVPVIETTPKGNGEPGPDLTLDLEGDVLAQLGGHAWFAQKAAVKRAFGREPRNKADLMMILKDEGHIA